MKKSQISVFIIIGLILLVVVALAMYVYDLNIGRIDNDIEKSYLIKTTVDPVKLYVENCLEQVSEEPIRKIGENGGTLAPLDFRWYMDERYNFLCFNDHSGRCVHSLLLRQDMETELEDAIRENLSQCIDLSIFERQGFDITEGQMKVNVTIGMKHLYIMLNYPLRFKSKNDDLDLRIEDFSTDVQVPLGLIFDKSIEIINAENTEGYFDIVDHMYYNGNEINIEKHRPYPDILYTLISEGYMFRFAIEGDPSVSLGLGTSLGPGFGCCYNLYDSACYKNVPEYICRGREGIYDYNQDCVCPETHDTMEVLCDGRECMDCDKTYNYVTGNFDGPTKKHGESWCVYDGIAGKGYDYVGTRHYMHYCIDGVEYVEECRDYREELCTEEEVIRDGEIFEKAACRINRWQDCNDCMTKECCEDLDYRDCHWKDWLNTEHKCVPYVPPGFRFWESGSDICSQASETKECSGFSCPNIWVDDTAVSCYMQGDCGNYRNINDRITYEGFFNSDLYDKVRDYVYLDDGLNKRGDEYSIDIGIDNREQAMLFDSPSLEEAVDNFILIISTGLNYIDRMASLSFSDFLNPFDLPDITILDVSVCDVWQAPFGGEDCGSCEKDPFRPCTEYRCMSLGKQCMYEEINGTPRCYINNIDDNTPPSIVFDDSAISEGYEAEEVELVISPNTYIGYEISPAIEPYRLLTFQINTSEETVCRMKYLPRLKYVKSPSYYFGDSRFSETHNITMRIPGRIEVPTKVMDFLNLTSLGEIIDLLEEPKKFLERYESKYSTQIKIYEFVTGDNIVDKVRPYTDVILDFINEFSDMVPFYKNLFKTILENFEDGTYFLFVECKDRAGNENVQEMFIRFSIDEYKDDNLPPVILGFRPENASFISNSDKTGVFFYLNEPAECRYDFVDRNYDSMRYEFKCPNSRLNMNPKYGGSYECYDYLNTTDVMTIYIRCMDNPKTIMKYPLNIALDDVSGVSGATESIYLNVTGSSVYASARILRNYIVFNVVDDDVDLHLYIDEPMNCTYSYNDEVSLITDCEISPKIEQGLYECVEDIVLETNATSLRNISFILDLHKEPGINAIDGVSLKDGKLKINYSGQDKYDIYLNDSGISLELSIDDSFHCKYKEEEENTSSDMACMNINNKTHCIKNLLMNNTYEIVCTEDVSGVSGTGVNHFEVECEVENERQQNINPASTEYVLYRSPQLLIVKKGPESEVSTDRPTLYVQTNNPSLCGYYKDLMLGTILMDRLNETYHEMSIDAKKGSHKYYFQCRDEWGNVATSSVDFFVI